MFETSQGAGKRGSVSVEGHSETDEQLQSQAVGHIPNQITKHPKQNKQQKPHALACQSNVTCKVPLVGKKSLLKCLIGGYPVTVLFDSGSEVNMIDQEWADTHIPNYPVRPLSELVEEELGIYAVTGDAIPYSG